MAKLTPQEGLQSLKAMDLQKMVRVHPKGCFSRINAIMILLPLALLDQWGPRFNGNGFSTPRLALPRQAGPKW
jgi:hypothetical protein